MYGSGCRSGEAAALSPSGADPHLLNLPSAFHRQHSFRFLLGTFVLECSPFSSRTFAHDLVVSPISNLFAFLALAIYVGIGALA